jgi:uncharacterized protein YbjT (DUF2867 family)
MCARTTALAGTGRSAVRIGIAGGTGTVGRHVTDLVRENGHEPVVLARSTGFDLTSAVGLADALDGIDGMIDVLSTPTLSAKKSRKFFGTTTAALLGAEVDAGVRHHVVLSIVNAGKVAAGYYAGKAAQEHSVMRGAVPWSILRVTQFHEFSAQTLARSSKGRLALVPVMRTQPVAAREVADRLVRLVLDGPGGIVPDFAGPREEVLVDMVRAYARATRSRTRILQIRLPGAMGTAMREGGMLPSRAAERGRQSFSEWLEQEERGRTSV